MRVHSPRRLCHYMDEFLATHNLSSLASLLAQHGVTLEVLKLGLLSVDELVKTGVPIGSAKLLLHHARASTEQRPAPNTEIWLVVDDTPATRTHKDTITSAAKHLGTLGARLRFCRLQGMQSVASAEELVTGDAADSSFYASLESFCDDLIRYRVTAQEACRLHVLVVSAATTDTDAAAKSRAKASVEIVAMMERTTMALVPLVPALPSTFDAHPVLTAAKWGDHDIYTCTPTWMLTKDVTKYDRHDMAARVERNIDLAAWMTRALIAGDTNTSGVNVTAEFGDGCKFTVGPVNLATLTVRDFCKRAVVLANRDATSDDPVTVWLVLIRRMPATPRHTLAEAGVSAGDTLRVLSMEEYAAMRSADMS